MTHPVLNLVSECAGGDWQRMLEFADRTQMTLLMRDAPDQPAWFLHAIATRAAKNAVRRRRLLEAYSELRDTLHDEGVPFVLLKGFTHDAFGIDPAARVQYDIDLLCEPLRSADAVAALHRIGYRFHSQHSVSDQHLPPLVKPDAWQWRGDYCDPDMPIPVELHTTLWDPETDRIPLAGVELFWDRRNSDALALPDRLAYAALHALRHILRNDARPAHVFELASFLNTHAQDADFWTKWSALHGDALRGVQSVAFRFAVDWFGCAVPPRIDAEFSALPSTVRTWFESFSRSPLRNLIRPNKDVVWLHLALLRSTRDAFLILRRRLFPFHLSKTHGSTSGARARHHASTVAPALASGLRFWLRSTTS